ncbi:hypothetical protein LXL04_016204 [Taraxacum kok-saghyz]
MRMKLWTLIVEEKANGAYMLGHGECSNDIEMIDRLLLLVKPLNGVADVPSAGMDTLIDIMATQENVVVVVSLVDPMKVFYKRVGKDEYNSATGKLRRFRSMAWQNCVVLFLWLGPEVVPSSGFIPFSSAICFLSFATVFLNCSA